MTKVSPPPLGSELIDEDIKPTMPWVLFFNALFQGDTGTDWTPTFTDLTEVGDASFSGKIYRIGQRLAYFQAIVTPGTNTSSTAGTTYIDNFPLTLIANGGHYAVTSTTAAVGACDASTNRIYTPTWTTIATPVTICGIVEAQ